MDSIIDTTSSVLPRGSLVLFYLCGGRSMP